MLRLIGDPKLNSNRIIYHNLVLPAHLESDKKTCKIYDARGYYAALGNKISGKGY